MQHIQSIYLRSLLSLLLITFRCCSDVILMYFATNIPSPLYLYLHLYLNILYYIWRIT